MSFSNDDELRELFRQEIEERVQQLVQGARTMASGEVTDEVAGTMFREGHTIKGTSRVMGFDAMSRAGQALEMVWRKIQHGDLEPSSALGEALEDLAAAIPGALDEDAEEGGAALRVALKKLDEVVVVQENIDGPEPPAEELPPESLQEAPSGEAFELGGLLNALDTWASEETARVNSAQMYRLINTVASLSIHTQALQSMVLDLSDSLGDEESGTSAVQRLAGTLQAMEKTINSARQTALTLAAAQLKDVTNTFPQLVNYLAKKTGKEVRFELIGDEESVDRQILERLADPLRQLIVNAIEHGIEMPQEREEAGKPPTATLAVRAMVKEHRMEIVVEDDGRGIDWSAVHRTALRRGLLPEGQPPEEGALRALLFAPGFSTALAPSELVGDGTGLTMVAESMEQLRGSLDLETELGSGTRVTIAVPTSRALQDALLVWAAGNQWGIPEAAVADTFPIHPDEVVVDARRTMVTWLDQLIPATSFAAAVGLSEDEQPTQAVVVRSPAGQVALTVPNIIGQRQVAAKELGPLLAGVPHLTGAALLGGGDVVVLVDPGRLAERAREVPEVTGPRPRVLVVDDSQGARQVVAGALASDGFDASVAGSVEEALALLVESPVDALVVDYSMPGSDGISLVRQIRQLFGRLPIIMLSGVATSEDQERARLAGVDAYFDKADFREGALASTLRSLVAERKTEVAG